MSKSCQKKMDLKFVAICAYHKDNFGILTDQQQQDLLSFHNTVLNVKNWIRHNDPEQKRFYSHYTLYLDAKGFFSASMPAIAVVYDYCRENMFFHLKIHKHNCNHYAWQGFYYKLDSVYQIVSKCLGRNFAIGHLDLIESISPHV